MIFIQQKIILVNYLSFGKDISIFSKLFENPWRYIPPELKKKFEMISININDTLLDDDSRVASAFNEFFSSIA